MVYFLTFFFVAASLVLVARPLFQSTKHLRLEGEMFLSGREKKLALLRTKKQLLLDNVTEHEFEFAMGKMSQEDFERLRQGCENDLRAVDKSIKSLEVTSDIDDLIEREVEARRKLK